MEVIDDTSQRSQEFSGSGEVNLVRKTSNGFGTAGFVLSLFPFIYAWIKQIILWSTDAMYDSWRYDGYRSFREMGHTVWRVLDVSWNVIWLHALIFSMVGLIFGIVAKRTLTLSIVGLCFVLTYLYIQTGDGIYEFIEVLEDILDF